MSTWKSTAFKLNIKIVPIGINYSNPHHFRSQVFINFGKALDVFQYADLFKQDEKKSVLKLTDEIRKKLESLLIIVKDQKSDRLIKQIERLYLNEPRFYDSPRDKATQDFSRAKEIVNVVEYIQNTTGCRVEGVAFKESTSAKLIESLDDFTDISENKKKFLI